MNSRITEDILFGLIRVGINDQAILAKVKDIVQFELAKYDVSRKETVIAVRDNFDADVVKRFFISKTSAGLTKRTLQMYRTTLQRLLKKIGKNIKDINSEDVRLLLMQMRLDGVELVSIDNDRRVLSTFFSWVYEEGFIKCNPLKKVEKVKYQKKVKNPFTEDEMELLRIHAKTDRNRAIIEFLYSTGCRVMECVQLNRTDIDFEKRECTVLGKGNKQRRVFLSSRCAVVLKQYLDTRKDKEPALFIAPYQWTMDDDGTRHRIKKPTRLLSHGIEDVIRMSGKRAGIKNAHPHRLRRTCATFALRRGMPIEQVSKMLGHSSIETTTIYANSTMDEVKASHDKYI